MAKSGCVALLLIIVLNSPSLSQSLNKECVSYCVACDRNAILKDRQYVIYSNFEVKLLKKSKCVEVFFQRPKEGGTNGNFYDMIKGTKLYHTSEQFP